MSDGDDGQAETLVLDYEFDEPPEKVWQAVSDAEIRQAWLPDELLADGEPVSAIPGREVRYRMEDDAPPFLASVVTFEVRPRPDGGTSLRIIHRLADARLEIRPRAANGNSGPLMRAA